MIKLAIVPVPGSHLPSLSLFTFKPPISPSHRHPPDSRERERENRLPDPLNSLQLLFINDRISSQSSKKKNIAKKIPTSQLSLLLPFFLLFPSPKNRAPIKTIHIFDLIIKYTYLLTMSILLSHPTLLTFLGWGGTNIWIA